MAWRLPATVLGGRVRTSTVILAVAFVAVLALYFWVRPDPAQTVVVTTPDGSTYLSPVGTPPPTTPAPSSRPAATTPAPSTTPRPSTTVPGTVPPTTTTTPAPTTTSAPATTTPSPTVTPAPTTTG